MLDFQFGHLQTRQDLHIACLDDLNKSEFFGGLALFQPIRAF